MLKKISILLKIMTTKLTIICEIIISYCRRTCSVRTTRRDGINGTEGTEDPYFDMKMIQRPVFNNNNHILR